MTGKRLPAIAPDGENSSSDATLGTGVEGLSLSK